MACSAPGPTRSGAVTLHARFFSAGQPPRSLCVSHAASGGAGVTSSQMASSGLAVPSICPSRLRR